MILPEHGIDLKQTLEKLEQTLIEQALERTGFNSSAAAALLGIKPANMVAKRFKYKFPKLQSGRRRKPS